MTARRRCEGYRLRPPRNACPRCPVTGEMVETIYMVTAPSVARLHPLPRDHSAGHDRYMVTAPSVARLHPLHRDRRGFGSGGFQLRHDAIGRTTLLAFAFLICNSTTLQKVEDMPFFDRFAISFELGFR